MTKGSVAPYGHGALSTFRRSKEARYGLLFAIPAILGFAIFTLGPMVLSMYFSLTDYTGIGASHFVGLNNFSELFGSDPFFKNSLKVTLLYIAMSVPLNITVAFFIAYLLSQKIRFRGFFRLAYYLPTVVPLVATSIIWRWLLDPSTGIINYYCMALNLPKMRFLYDELTVLPSLAVMGVWQTGATMLVFLAGLQGIPQTLYEAADVDGARSLS
ncbi:MAG: sugar ABC transporter permease, partial [Clostridia bacterium]|nr:sugar ABC transporter permease [Clostridia bacterium]